MIVLYLTVR